jgi:hypothetical protein
VVPVPIYRVSIAVYTPAPDGGWDVAHGGPMTSFLFAPFGDDDGSIPLPSGLRRVASGGSRPLCTVLAPPGSELVPEGSTLRLKVPGRPGLLDAFAAKLAGTHRRDGFDLVRQITVTFGPYPEHPPAPTKQLAMTFGD